MHLQFIFCMDYFEYISSQKYLLYVYGCKFFIICIQKLFSNKTVSDSCSFPVTVVVKTPPSS